MKLSCLLLFAIPERFAKYFIIYHIYLIWHSVSNKPPISSTPILTTKHGLLPSLYSDDRFWPQWICWATNHSFFFLTTDLRVIMASCQATWKVCFLTSGFWGKERLQKSYTIMYNSNVYDEYVTACMCS